MELLPFESILQKLRLEDGKLLYAEHIEKQRAFIAWLKTYIKSYLHRSKEISEMRCRADRGLSFNGLSGSSKISHLG